MDKVLIKLNIKWHSLQKKFKSNDFILSVITLMTGTALAQTLPVVFSPILTRIYSPEVFGVLGLYTALLSLASNFSTGRYEMAIMLPRTERNAIRVAYNAFVISLFFFTIQSILSFIFGKELLKLLGKDESLFWSLTYLLPLGVFVFSIYSILNYFCNRRKLFKLMAGNRILQNASIVGSQIGTGVAGFSGFGLIISDIIGRVITLCLLVSRFRSIKLPRFSFNKQKLLFLRYKSFPIHEVPASIFNTLAYQLPVILIPFYFSAAEAGMYFLVFRVLMLPVALIGDAILDVFRPRAISDMEKFGNCKSIYVKTLTALGLVGLLPALILAVFSPNLFVMLFGETWLNAGYYAQILAVMAYFRLVSAPLSYMFFVREKLKTDMYLQFVFLIFTIVSFLVGALYFDSIIIFISMISFSGVLFYLLQLRLSYNLACNNEVLS